MSADGEIEKCETKSQAEKRHSEWCKKCSSEQYHSEEELDNLPCRHCKIIHLVRNMFEKIEGHLCRSCTRKYERGLMRKIA
jgi:hypothetical protein